MTKTFNSLSNICLETFKNKTLLFDTTENQTINYADAFDLVKLISIKLKQENINKGDVILTYTPLSLEGVLLCWACLYNGIVFVPVDHNWPQNLLLHVISETHPKLILTDSERLLNFSTHQAYYKPILTGSQNGTNNHPSLFDWIRDTYRQVDTTTEQTKPHDLALILYTSGSTGTPKGVMLSQKALFNSGELVATHFEWDSIDVFLNLGDLHSMSGIRNTCFAPLHAGASFIIANNNERNNALKTIELINNIHVTYIGVAPTVIRQLNILFTEKRKKQLTSLKAILCTGGPLAKDQLKDFYEKYNIPVLNYYGLTETAGICSGHNLKSFNPNDNSIGPKAGAQLTILPDTSFSNDKNIGELLVKSENLMIGYFNLQAETARVIKDGYFYTGDIVRKREDGCFELLSRKRNIIKNIHSELIYLEEIDQALESHPLIKEASTCAYSKTAEDEKIVAFIVLNENQPNNVTDLIKELKNYLINKLGKNRIPWCYYIEKSLPHNSSGKIQRQKLNEKLNEYLKSHRERYF